MLVLGSITTVQLLCVRCQPDISILSRLVHVQWYTVVVSPLIIMLLWNEINNFTS